MGAGSGVAPRDDRAWPRGALVASVLMGLVAVAVGAGLAVGAAGQGWMLMAAVLAGFVLEFGLTASVYVAGIRPWMRGHPVPYGPQLSVLAGLTAAIVVLVVFDSSVGFAMLAGLVAGPTFANAWAVRVARKNRASVDQVEAAAARERAAAARDAQNVPEHRRERAGQNAQVGRALRAAVAVERRRAVAWLIATVVVTAVGGALDAPVPVAVVVAVGGLALVWVLRRLWGAWLALRDFSKAATAPRRAFVVLLHDPAPRMVRPLLGIWSRPPAVREGHVPAPECVYRCDEEHDALECYQGSVVVHEAWVDTGPRRWSTPRWVAADAGIALPHRRSAFGRWYMGSLIRGERPEPPEPLTGRPPHPADEVIVELGGGVEGSFASALASRVAQLGVVALLVYWLI